jgi:hypothetical protein
MIFRPELQRHSLKINANDLKLITLAETADATIKRKFIELSIRENQNWQEYIQGIFEKRVLEPIIS